MCMYMSLCECACVCVFECVCQGDVCACGKDTGFPRAGIRGSELLGGCWDLNTGSLKGQSILLVTVPSLQPTCIQFQI